MEDLLAICGLKETALALKLATHILEQAKFAQYGVPLGETIFVGLLKRLKVT